MHIINEIKFTPLFSLIFYNRDPKKNYRVWEKRPSKASLAATMKIFKISFELSVISPYRIFVTFVISQTVEMEVFSLNSSLSFESISPNLC